jgi:predicted O-methyltransferase YrrM
MRTAETSQGALALLGFDGDRLDELDREFDVVAPSLYAQMLDVARSVGDDEAMRRVAEPSESSREGKRLLYTAARVLAPAIAVETGPFNGASTAFILAALERNARGRLVSFDLDEAVDALGVPLPSGRKPTWLVPEDLRPRLELVLGDARSTLAPHLRSIGSIEFFFHDSLHTFAHMWFEYRVAWRHLRGGGLLVTDDARWTPAFRLFALSRRATAVQTGNLGLLRRR